MNRLLFCLIICIIIIPFRGQTQIHEECGQHLLLRELLKSPQRLKIHLAEQKQLQKEEIDFILNFNKTKGTIYKVPVVFHVIHNGGVENISRDQILDALSILNRDLRLLNPDTAYLASSFQALATDVEIEFILATKTPDGSCFSGVTRTQSTLSYVSDYSSADQVNAVMSGNDVYQGLWSGHSYLNVFICGNVKDGVAGYTHYPSNWYGTSMENGIWLRHTYVGSIGTGSVYRSRTFTHEVGHWLNLPHTWGSTNDPGLISNCNTDDGVPDTPNTIGSTSCNLNENSCGPTANVQNYMEYSGCKMMFTSGQSTKMRTAINSTIGGRNNLSTTSNLVATGTFSTPEFCQVDFTADNTIICSGSDISLTDESYHNPIGWSWTFQGGTPSSSTNQNPIITYNNPGTYEVSLSATADSNIYMSKIKSNYITVLPSGGGNLIPYSESFENINLPNNDWFISNNSWSINSDASSNGNSSVRFNNLGNIDGGIHELESGTIDLSSVTSAQLSFKYAYANTSSENTDKLQILASKDCGKTWSVRKDISNQFLPTAPVHSGLFIPSASEWQEVIVTSIVSTYCIPDFRFKFSFYSGGGNDFYIDDINISINEPASANEFDVELLIFPNPADNNITISSSYIITGVELFDLAGKMLKRTDCLINKLQIPVHMLDNGLYLLRVYNTQGVKTIPFEKQ